MKILSKKKLIKIIGATALLLTTLTCLNIPTYAATTFDTGIEVIGETKTVSVEDAKSGNPIEVKFDVNTTFDDIKGLMGGVYGIRYNPDKMDLVSGSLQHSNSLMSMVNEDYTVTTMNGVPSQKGDIINGVAFVSPTKSSQISLKFKNLFKDGDRTPIEVQFINRTEDRLTVERTSVVGAHYPQNPVIVNAKISLSPIAMSLNGSNSIQKGQNATYTATVTNTLADNGINWSITGANHASTTIDTAGKLTVSKNETASSLIVTATSKEDGTVKKTKTVSLTNSPQLSVAITGKDQLIKGTKGNLYTSTVVNASNKAVTYSLTGQSSAKTIVDANGNITVGIDETASTLSLKATSVEDTTKNSSMTIKVIDKTYTIVKTELPVSKIEMKTGTTEDALDVEAQKNKIAKVTIKTNDGKQYVIEVPVLNYVSDKDVVDENGVLVEGKFNLIYTLDLPNINIDENDTITMKPNKTNIIGSNTKGIPVKIASKSNEPNKDNGTEGGTTGGDTTNKEPIKNAIKTGDEVNIALYTGMTLIAGMAMIAAFVYKRKKIEE